MIRRCDAVDFDEILEIVNAAAEAYRGVIPADRWHEPYMPADELTAEIEAGVRFWGLEEKGELSGVMGLQHVRDVSLIRHAYVRPARQHTGIGRRLLEHIRADAADRPLLVGTWAAASWAIRFYEANGFRLVTGAETVRLLHDYWSVPERQIDTSVVLRWQP